MVKNVAAVVAGLLAMMGTVWLIQYVGHYIFPPTVMPEFDDPEGMRRLIESMPVIALAFVPVSWGAGAFVGTAVACRIGVARAVVFAGIVGGADLLAAASMLLQYPHPLWVAILGVVGIVAGAWFAMKLNNATTEPAE